MISITEATGNRKMWQLMEELSARITGMMNQYPAMIAEEYLELLQSTAPDIPGYAKNLKVQQFTVGKDQVYGVSLPGYAHSNRLKVTDKARVVLYVTPKARGRTPADPAVLVLERYNPWTMETLPFEPDRKVAAIMSRRITEREVKIIEGYRTKDRKSQVDAELRDLGVKLQRPHPTLLSRKVSRDLMFEIIRAEYGLVGEQHVAHIRPSLRKIQASVEPALWRWWTKRLVALGERRWQRPIRKAKGRPSFAKKVRPLQDLILDGDTPSV